MEPNGLQGGLFSGIASGMLGLEMPLHPQSQPQPQPQPQQQNPQTNPQNPHHYPQMVAFSHHPHDTELHHTQTQSQQSVKQQHGYLFSSKQKQQQLSPLSDEDELGLTPDDSAGDGKRKASSSPWQRMKWTDSMVKLLILAVLYIGDEVGSDGNDKKKTGALLQKKGKWKSVSRAMLERGFYVSPQQCEDKFNDLNKRYKRVNEILGKGTACRVVENQSLLETMDLTPKMKEEVKKLLNSKHLFFKEMCAYHSTCHGSGTGGTPGANHSPEVATEPSVVQQQQAQHRQGSLPVPVSPMVLQLRCEVSNVIQDGAKTSWEKKQWMKMKLLQLEEQQISYQYQAFELEKQRLKWVKFSSKKEREMEKAKLVNERRRLENESMLLALRQKDYELLDHQHHHQQQHSSNKRSDPSSITG
ncbi:hypothetical protein CUMW_006660 [Citrus unshiu]|nr:hypothetical protein CUMW_006660 [Citrus unshiu]